MYGVQRSAPLYKHGERAGGGTTLFKIWCSSNISTYSPAGIWFSNDVVSTSMRRHYVVSTLIKRHFTPCARWEVSNALNAIRMCHFTKKSIALETYYPYILDMEFQRVIEIFCIIKLPQNMVDVHDFSSKC